MADAIVYMGRTRAELECQYDIDKSVPDPGMYLARYGAESERVRRMLTCTLDIPYGAHPLEKLDIYPGAQPDAPVAVFIHGGGWRGSSKTARGFPAESFVAAGMTYVAIDYPLAPAASMDEIVAAVRRAIAWLWKNGASHGAGRDRIFVMGNSAGGHLGAMLAAQGWQEALDLPADVVKGLCGISGAYDLTPHALVEVRSYLNLTPDSVARNSPIHHLPARGLPVLLAVGGDEPEEYLRQTRAYAQTLAAAGVPVEVLVLDGHNHFSIIGELNVPGPLRDGVLRLMTSTDGGKRDD